MKAIDKLPQLDDSSRNNGYRGFSRNGSGPARGGSYAGNRNGDRSSKTKIHIEVLISRSSSLLLDACFKCKYFIVLNFMLNYLI